MSNQTPAEIGSDRQLFVDDSWVADSTGVERVLHSPTRQSVALEPEHPWEVGGLSYLIAFPDQGKFRGWYRADPQLQDSDYNSITCYAESDDGIHWTKPSLGLIEFNGSKDNNIVWTEPGINLAPFKDAKPRRKAGGAVQGIHPRQASNACALLSRWTSVADDARGADPDGIPLRHAQYSLLGHVAKGIRGVLPRCRGSGHERLLHRRSMDSPQHVDGLFELGTAGEHRLRRHALGTFLHEFVHPVRSSAGDVPDVPLAVRPRADPQS